MLKTMSQNQTNDWLRFQLTTEMFSACIFMNIKEIWIWQHHHKRKFELNFSDQTISQVTFFTTVILRNICLLFQLAHTLKLTWQILKQILTSTLHDWKFTSTPTGEQGSWLASHFHPGEITPIAIWRINSVTYGNFKIHLLCVGCAWTRNESCSLVPSLMQNSFWIIISTAPLQKKRQKKEHLMTKSFNLDHDYQDQTFDQEPSCVSLTERCRDKSIYCSCSAEASKFWPLSETPGALF